MPSNNYLAITPHFGWFLGQFTHNLQHQHYALQLSMALDAPLTVQTENETLTTNTAVLLKPNVPHRLTCEGQHLLVLINPASTIGHFWNQLTPQNSARITTQPVQQLQQTAVRFLNNTLNASDFNAQIRALFAQYDCFCNEFVHRGDARIEQAIAYLHQHSERIVALEEIAEHCHLSPSRFQHLFKNTTGMSYRRAQRWNKLTQALPYLGQKSLTELAHEAGFADSAHFSRTFKENFGFYPREVLKDSPFIQV